MLGAKGSWVLPATVLMLVGCDALVVVAPADGDGTADGGGAQAGGATSTTGAGAAGGFPPDTYDGYAACYAACDADPCIANEELCAEYCFEDIFPGCGPESLDYHRCANQYCDPDSDPEVDCVVESDALRTCKGNLECGPVECTVTDDGCVCSNDCEFGHTRRSDCSSTNPTVYCTCFLDDDQWFSCSMSGLDCSAHGCCDDYW